MFLPILIQKHQLQICCVWERVKELEIQTLTSQQQLSIKNSDDSTRWAYNNILISTVDDKTQTVQWGR